MTQNEFFNILMDGFKDLPETKLQEIISYYQNNFSLGLSAGKTEEEIINQLGDPNSIVNKYRNGYLDMPINSGFLFDNSTINPNVNKDSADNNIIYTKEDNMVTDNKSNDPYGDFKTNDSFNSISSSSSQSGIKTNSSNLNDFKASDSYKDINSNDNFYNLNTLEALKDNQENNNTFINTNISDYSSDDANYSFNNSKFNNDKNSNASSNNTTNKMSQFNVNTILKICIAILSLIIFFPVITGIIGCIIGLLGVAISILVASIGVLVGGTFTSFMGLPNVPAFVANFPYPVIVLFSLGSISLSILLMFLFYYFCKFFVRIFIKIYHSLKSEGGAL